MKPRILSPERAAQLCREYYLGKEHTVKRIAARNGIHPHTVVAYAKRQHKEPA